jgi:5-methyltetrahydrofolate--homocysteine methyltransferase
VEKFLAALGEHKPDILGMSALLTTTMPYMKVVIDTMKEKGIRNDYIVLVGGAPLNEEFGKAVGADAYCRDAAIAVETAKSLLLAANAMKGGMEILRPLLAETGVEPIGKVVIGTVKGDIHDIGKNLVSMMLEGAGFEVINLGINNAVEKFLAALEEHKPDILGMSALLTTTMPYMKVVIDTMKEKGIRNDYIVLVGGAPLNEEFGKAVGADAYCRDAAIAVETAKSLLLARRNAARAH